MENIVYIILTIILIIILVILLKYNQLIRLQNRVKKAKASIAIYLKKRFDLIPNLVETVKGYSKYESGTLEDIVSLRSNYMSQKNLDIKEVEHINDQLNKYLAVVENYPDLKANTQYLNLQAELSNIEDELERARHIYNNEVTIYNTLIETVPSNFVASMFAFKKANLLEIEQSEQNNIKVEL